MTAPAYVADLPLGVPPGATADEHARKRNAYERYVASLWVGDAITVTLAGDRHLRGYFGGMRTDGHPGLVLFLGEGEALSRYFFPFPGMIWGLGELADLCGNLHLEAV